MGTISLILLALVIIAFFSIASLLWRSRTTNHELRWLTGKVREMAGSRADRGNYPPTDGSIEELEEAIKPLGVRLEALASDLGGERERVGVIMDTIDAGVLVLDRQRRVNLLNRAAEEMFKVTDVSAVGRPLITLIRDHEMDAIVQRCLETARKQTGVVQMAGTQQYLELKAALLSNGVVVMIRDLTDIKRLEKVRQDFVANVSHELRTPIASLKAMVETLQNGAVNDKTIADDFLRRMQVETDKLAQMVSELGELSRIESGDLSLNLESVDITELVRRVVDRLGPQAQRAQLSLDKDIPVNLPPIMGDKNRIEQVLVNLVHNAIKFTPEHGRVTVSAKVEGDRVLISVGDTGIGIPADELPRIFERFYKVDRARSGSGTGLGLAIAKHIVQAHGGNIRVESTEGKGSTFTFSLAVAGS